MKAAVFIIIATGVTLALLHFERRWPRLLRRSCLIFLILGILSFAGSALEILLLQRTRLADHVSAVFLALLDYGLPLLGVLSFALALFASVALLCAFCVRQLHGRGKT